MPRAANWSSESKVNKHACLGPLAAAANNEPGSSSVRPSLFEDGRTDGRTDAGGQHASSPCDWPGRYFSLRPFHTVRCGK